MVIFLDFILKMSLKNSTYRCFSLVYRTTKIFGNEIKKDFEPKLIIFVWKKLMKKSINKYGIGAPVVSR